MKIPIYHAIIKCRNCKKEIDIYYPEKLAYKHSLGNIRNMESQKESEKNFVNICPYCDTYQENRIIWNHILTKFNNSKIEDSCVWVNEILNCSKCSANIDYEIIQYKSADILNFFKGSWGDKCLSCMTEEDVNSIIEILHGMSRCSVCERLIYDIQDTYDGITLDDRTIIRSKLNKHHVNYERNKTIIVCSECHMKIHNSPIKKYKMLRSVD